MRAPGWTGFAHCHCFTEAFSLCLMWKSIMSPTTVKTLSVWFCPSRASNTDPSEHGQGRQTMTEELFLFVLSRLDSIAVGSREFTGQVKGSFSFSSSHSSMVLVAWQGLLSCRGVVVLGVAFPCGGLFQSAAMFRWVICVWAILNTLTSRVLP